jgi:hypothetical protein
MAADTETISEHVAKGSVMSKKKDLSGVVANWDLLAQHMKKNIPGLKIKESGEANALFSRRWLITWKKTKLVLDVYVYEEKRQLDSYHHASSDYGRCSHAAIGDNLVETEEWDGEVRWCYENVEMSLRVEDFGNRILSMKQMRESEQETMKRQEKEKQQEQQQRKNAFFVTKNIQSFMEQNTVTNIHDHMPTLSLRAEVPKVVKYGKKLSIPIAISNIKPSNIVLYTWSSGLSRSSRSREAIKILEKTESELVVKPQKYGVIRLSLDLYNRQTLLHAKQIYLEFASRANIETAPSVVTGLPLLHHRIVETPKFKLVNETDDERASKPHSYMVHCVALDTSKIVLLQFRYLKSGNSMPDLRTRLDKAFLIEKGKKPKKLDAHTFNLGLLNYNDPTIQGNFELDHTDWEFTTSTDVSLSDFFQPLPGRIAPLSKNTKKQDEMLDALKELGISSTDR